MFDYKSVQEAFESQFPHQTRLQRKAFSKSDFYRQNLSYSLFLCYFCGMNPSLHKRRTETPPWKKGCRAVLHIHFPACTPTDRLPLTASSSESAPSGARFKNFQILPLRIWTNDFPHYPLPRDGKDKERERNIHGQNQNMCLIPDRSISGGSPCLSVNCRERQDISG